MPSLNRKELNIAIVIDPSSAKQGAMRAAREMVNVFKRASHIVSRQFGFQNISQLKSQISQIQQLAKGSLSGTGAKEASADITKLSGEIKKLQATIKGLKGSGGIGSSGTKGKSSKTLTDLEQVGGKLDAKEMKYLQGKRDEIMKAKQDALNNQLAMGQKEIDAAKSRQVELIKIGKQRVTMEDDFAKAIEQKVDQHNKRVISAENKKAQEILRINKKRFNQQHSEAIKMNKELDKYQSAIREASGALGVSRGQINKIGMSTKDLEKYTHAMKSLRFESRKMQKGMKGLNAAFADFNSDTTVKGQGQVMGANMGVIGKEQAVIKELHEKYEGLNKITKEHGMEVEKTHGKFKKLARSTMNYMKFQIGWFLGAGVIFGIVGAITQMAKAALEFSQTLKDMQAITGRTAKEINLVAKAAKDVAMTTPMAANEAAKMALQLIRAGLSAKTASTALSIASKVAIIAGEDAKTVADTIATAIMAWKLNNDEIAMAGETIAASMNFSRLTVEDLGTAFNYLAGVMSSFNKDFQETNAILSVYSNLGVRASTISTGLVQLFSQFAAPTEKARKKLENMGIALHEINPMTHTYSEILKRLEKAGFGAADALGIFETRAGRALIFALRAGSDEFDRMLKKIQESKQLTEGYKKAMEGPINAFKQLYNRIQAAAIEIGQTFTPVIKIATDILGLFAKVIYYAIHLLSQWPTLVVLAAGATLLFAKRLNQLRKAMMSTIAVSSVGAMGTFSKAFMRAGKIVKGLTISLKGLSKVMAAIRVIWQSTWLGKILTIVGAIAAFAGLDRLLFGSTSKQDKFNEGLEKSKNLTKGIEENMSGINKGFDDAQKAAQLFRQEIEQIKKSQLTTSILPILDNKNLTESNKKIKELINQLQEAQIDTPTIKKGSTIPAMFGKAIEPEMKVLKNDIKTVKSFWHSVDVGASQTIGHVKKSFGDLDVFLVKFFGDPAGEAYWNREAAAARKLNEALKKQNEIKQQLKKEEGQRDIYIKQTMDQLMKGTEESVKRYMEWDTAKNNIKAYQKIFQAQMSEALKGNNIIAQEEIILAFMEKLKEFYTAGTKQIQNFINSQKDSFKDLKQSLNDVFKEYTYTMEMKEIIRKGDYEKEKANLNALMKENDRLYQYNLISAKDYWNKKMQIQETLNQKEIDNIQATTQKSLDIKNAALKKEQDLKNNIVKQWKDTKDKIPFADTADAKTLQKEADVLADLWLKRENNIEQLKREIELIKERGIVSEDTARRMYAFLKAEEELRSKIDIATKPLKDKASTLKLQKELTQVQKEANELAGNWNEAAKDKIRLMELQRDLMDNNLQQQIATIQLSINEDPTNEILLNRRKILEEILKLRKEIANQKINDIQGTPWGSFKQGMIDATKGWDDINTQMKRVGENTAQSMTNAFQNFFDYTSEGFLNFGDLAKSVLNELYKELVKVLIIQRLVQGITTAIGSVGTGNTGTAKTGTNQPGGYTDVRIGHAGGVVDSLKRFHTGGLNNDERLAVLQTGEGVVSRRGMVNLSRINNGGVTNPSVNVAVNIENQTGQPVDAKAGNIKFDGEKYVIGVVMKNINENGALGQVIRGRR